MDIVGLVIQLIAAAIGGNAVGKISKGFSLGGTGNSIAGAIGGVVLGQILNDTGRRTTIRRPFSFMLQCRRHAHRGQRSFEVVRPEIEDADEPRELGRQAVVLPDTGLQHAYGRRASGT